MGVEASGEADLQPQLQPQPQLGVGVAVAQVTAGTIPLLPPGNSRLERTWVKLPKFCAVGTGLTARIIRQRSSARFRPLPIKP